MKNKKPRLFLKKGDKAPGRHKLKPLQGDVHQLGGDILVGSDGKIKLAYYSKEPADRPTVKSLLAAMRNDVE